MGMMDDGFAEDFKHPPRTALQDIHIFKVINIINMLIYLGTSGHFLFEGKEDIVPSIKK